MASDNSSGEQSVTQWLVALRADQSTAGEKLWERYVAKLARLARKKLGNSSRRSFDEEDIVIEVFTDFLSGVKDRRFKLLSNREDLWQVLAMLTERAAINQIRRETAAKRGKGHVRGESAFAAPFEESAGPGIQRIAGREPTPEFAAEVADQYRRWMSALGSEELVQLAEWKMEGFTNEEIALKCGRTTRTIERKLSLIRQILVHELPAGEDV